MFEFTRRGYTGVYDQGWWNVARTLGVYVGFRVVELAGVGGGGEVVGSSW